MATGSLDADVPPDLSRTFFEAATRARPAPDRRVDYLELPGADHYMPMNAADPNFAALWAKAEAIWLPRGPPPETAPGDAP